MFRLGRSGEPATETNSRKLRLDAGDAGLMQVMQLDAGGARVMQVMHA